MIAVTRGFSPSWVNLYSGLHSCIKCSIAQYINSALVLASLHQVRTGLVGIELQVVEVHSLLKIKVLDQINKNHLPLALRKFEILVSKESSFFGLLWWIDPKYVSFYEGKMTNFHKSVVTSTPNSKRCLCFLFVCFVLFWLLLFVCYVLFICFWEIWIESKTHPRPYFFEDFTNLYNLCHVKLYDLKLYNK